MVFGWRCSVNPDLGFCFCFWLGLGVTFWRGPRDTASPARGRQRRRRRCRGRRNAGGALRCFAGHGGEWGRGGEGREERGEEKRGREGGRERAARGLRGWREASRSLCNTGLATAECSLVTAEGVYNRLLLLYRYGHRYRYRYGHGYAPSLLYYDNQVRSPLSSPPPTNEKSPSPIRTQPVHHQHPVSLERGSKARNSPLQPSAQTSGSRNRR